MCGSNRVEPVFGGCFGQPGIALLPARGFQAGIASLGVIGNIASAREELQFQLMRQVLHEMLVGIGGFAALRALWRNPGTLG